MILCLVLRGKVNSGLRDVLSVNLAVEDVGLCMFKQACAKSSTLQKLSLIKNVKNAVLNMFIYSR